jgi:hypothetical protein
MSDRVSDGLIAELQAKIDDGTPRGILWDMLAPILIMAAPFASTPEEVDQANEALAAMMLDGDDRALERLEIQLLLQQLSEAMERRQATGEFT